MGSAVSNFQKGIDFYYEKDEAEKALKYFLIAAKLGYRKAYSEIGLIFYREKHDPENAEKWFKKSEKVGVLSPEAAYEYGMLNYLDKNDWETGLNYLFKSAEGGYELAYGDIGTILFLYKEDISSAEEWFEKAEDADCFLAPSAYYYGLLLGNEKGDTVKSLKYFRKSAEEGFELAYGELGFLLYLEKIDIDEAEEWFEKADAADCLEAPHAYEYGNLLIKERGDIEKGNFYLKKAENDGY